ncbi:DUF1700 domain-containing protein [Melissococcus plutonius]|uniref:Membrane protein n=1 Tax=Melissococcus plutonius TaxID=33970 RepID=A0A2Z5Y4Y8_9ENTE|nr:DUF1700 domain-containing protein [Melissococcus plutonius]BAL62882.1 membrane protein [Melissococcus plutonius DAT561]MCV2498989.1 DUF1700 domain-containing protein [Melissococcus plutonius]MCV2501717.1 DUF1700 domain-containing protein [Melissococcus plutonius]MCV2505437.1 DUF1700 domain-containing protein [Melissococcus plutonius]MCV2507736.1 DUF1700 domain-containing protein [Melissococcus plutonius]
MKQTINEYINELKNYLSALEDEEFQDILEFYYEFLLDADTDSRKEIEAALGTPRQLARRILADYSLVETKIDDQQFSEKELQHQNTKRNLQNIWWIFLGLLAIPVGLPLVILLFSILLFFFCIIAAIVILLGAFLSIALFIIYKTFPIIWTQEWATAYFYIGCSLAIIACELLVIPLFLKLLQSTVSLAAKVARWIGRKVFTKHDYQQYGGQMK